MAYLFALNVTPREFGRPTHARFKAAPESRAAR